MIISKKENIGIECRILEPNINHLASEYISDNYERIAKYALSLLHNDKAYDLVNDVYVSILTAENDGDGFELSRGKTVEEFVFGRIKGYSKSDTYRSDTIETSSYVVVDRYTTEKPVIGIDGRVVTDRNGNALYESKDEVVKTKIKAVTVAATQSDDCDENTGIQFEYMNAACTNDSEMEEVDEEQSIEGSLQIAVDIASLNDIDIVDMFKSIDEMSEIIKKSNGYIGGTFGKICMLTRRHSDFADAVRDILEYSMEHKDKLRLILDNMSMC